MNKWLISVFVFSVAVNIAVMGTLVFFWHESPKKRADQLLAPPPPPLAGPEGREFLWMEKRRPDEPEKVFEERIKYHHQMEKVRRQINGLRKEIIVLLLVDPPPSDSLQDVVEKLAKKQVEAEQLTINHLLEIRPLLPREKWVKVVRDLRRQKRVMIRRKINRNGKKEKNEMEIQIM